MIFDIEKCYMQIKFVLREKRHFYSPPEAVDCVFVAEVFPFEENCSQIFSDFFLKLLLKLLDRDLTISDKTIMLISVCFFSSSFDISIHVACFTQHIDLFLLATSICQISLKEVEHIHSTIYTIQYFSFPSMLSTLLPFGIRKHEEKWKSFHNTSKETCF